MMSNSLQKQLQTLEVPLIFLGLERNVSPFANDVYEAVVYWRDLGRRALDGDGRVNYHERASEEQLLLGKLTEMLHVRSSEDQEKYMQVLSTSRRLLDELEGIRTDEEGYLGTLKIIRETFGFLQTEYGLSVVQAEPTGIRYSSGSVYVELQYSTDPSLSCSFGPEGQGEVSFWLEDLLFLYGDERYRTFQDKKTLQTKQQVEEWFTYLSLIWKKFGDEVLTNRPGIFDRLAVAQTLRDKEFAVAMDRHPKSFSG